MTGARPRPVHDGDSTLRGAPGMRGLVQVLRSMGRLAARRPSAWLAASLTGGVVLTLVAALLLAAGAGRTGAAGSMSLALPGAALLLVLQLGAATAAARWAGHPARIDGAQARPPFPSGVTFVAASGMTAWAMMVWAAAFELPWIVQSDGRGGMDPLAHLGAQAAILLVVTAPMGLLGGAWVGAVTRTQLEGRDRGDAMPLRLARVLVAWIVLAATQVGAGVAYAPTRNVPNLPLVTWLTPRIVLIHALGVLLLGLLLAAVWQVVEPDQDPDIGRVFE